MDDIEIDVIESFQKSDGEWIKASPGNHLESEVGWILELSGGTETYKEVRRWNKLYIKEIIWGDPIVISNPPNLPT